MFALNEFILIKSLKGTNYQIAFLFQVMILVLLFSVFFGEILTRVKKKKKLIRWVGVITRIPLIFLFFFPKNAMNLDENYYYQIAFLAILMVYYFANPLLFPAINHLLKASYSHKDFGTLYSYASTINKIMMMVSTFLFGLLLDYNNYAFTYIYPMVAVLGISSIFILTKIDYKVTESNTPGTSFYTSIISSLKNMVQILKGNKPYRDFEISFMFYGFAWMATAAVITIFFEKALHLNYSSIAFYKNAYNTLAILLLPYFGKLIGKIDPRKFAIYTFGFMLLHLFFLGLTEYYDTHFQLWGIKIYYSLIASYVFYGLFAATMALLWYIGSAYFCKDDEVSSYQSIHLTMTGFRGIFAPLVGVFFYDMFGFTGVFLLGIVSLAIAILIMLFSMKRKAMVNRISP
jgi:MFS family permease